jgi:hypothetical protein
MPRRTHRVAVDAVDLAADDDARLELERPERDLEVARDERRLRRRLVADELLEVALQPCSSSRRSRSPASMRSPVSTACATQSRIRTIAARRSSA